MKNKFKLEWTPWVAPLNMEGKEIKICKSSAVGKTREPLKFPLHKNMENIGIEKFLLKNTMPIARIQL